MKTPTIVAALFSMVLSAQMAVAQDYQRNGPTTGAPTPEQKLRNQAMTQQQAAEQEKLVDTDLGKVNGVIILPSEKDFVAAGVGGVKGTVVKGPAFLKAHAGEVGAVVRPYLGKPLTRGALTHMQKDLIALCFKLDHPVVDVFYPPQEIVDGVFQVVIFEGTVGKISVINPNGKYFSDKFITNQIRLKPGESITQSRLLDDLNWLNQNPEFLDVDASYRPAKWDPDKMSTANSSTTDIDLHVKDRPPVRVYGGYDDYGPFVLGQDRLFFGGNYGNLWGLDHQLNYQYTTDLNFDQFESHSASYIIPLPWRHTLTFYGGYDTFNADLGKIGDPGIESKGHTYQISTRYTAPLPKIGTWEQEISGGVDFKYSDNNLEFNVISLNRPITEIEQLVGEYHSFFKEGHLGYLKSGVYGYYSPGGISSRNHTTDFNLARLGATEHYFYGVANLEQGFFLPEQFMVLVRGTMQGSTERLLPSEELSLGGYDTIRGYSERVVAGDNGYYGSIELHSPVIKIGNITGQKDFPGGYVEGDTIELLAFYDYGFVHSKFPNSSDDPPVTMESVGGGVRLNVSHNLQVRLDYGFQLRNVHAQDTINPVAQTDSRRSQLVASATLSF